MADGNTTNYNFVLPEVGASPDTWGTKLNQNWSDLDTDLNSLETNKANLASPAFTGTPTAPTAATTTNTTQISTTAFVQQEITANAYSLPLAANGTRGGVQVGYTENGQNYPVELSSEKMFVNVPWTDTNTTYVSSDFDHDSLTGFVANEHIDWTVDNVTNNIHGDNIVYGTTASTACVGNDSRLSDARQCNNTFADAATSRTNLGLGYYATLTAASALSLTNTTDSTSTTTGAVQLDGGIGVAKAVYAGGNITANSDRRLKTNLQPIMDAVEKVCSLTGYTYDRTDMELRQTGVVAQEVLAVLPEAVQGSEETMYGVNYGSMVGLLIQAIKEQQTEINELKARLK